MDAISISPLQPTSKFQPPKSPLCDKILFFGLNTKPIPRNTSILPYFEYSNLALEKLQSTRSFTHSYRHIVSLVIPACIPSEDRVIRTNPLLTNPPRRIQPSGSPWGPIDFFKVLGFMDLSETDPISTGVVSPAIPLMSCTRNVLCLWGTAAH